LKLYLFGDFVPLSTYSSEHTDGRIGIYFYTHLR